MAKYINAAEAAEKVAEATGIRIADLVDVFAEISAADVAPVVHGRWIENPAPARKIYFECSHCGAQENKHTAIKGYYCWRCGAKMDGGAENG